MSQTAAIFLDAYRELNARKLFWVTMVISGVVVGAFAFIGINENGIRLIVWDVDVFGVTSEIMPPAVFYKSMFINFGIGAWLTWAAAILALVSTASIFPDFITGGSIDLALSKPIGRWRLFLTKYAAGLLFVALQVSVFCTGAFLVIGLRGGVWEPGVFLAIPIVVVFFSYLFCVCAFLGLLTRSTIAALILTILFWFGVYAVHATETTLLMFKTLKEQEIERQERSITQQEGHVSQMKQDSAPADTISRVQVRLDEGRSRLESDQSTWRKVDVAHRITIACKTLLPKTTETIGLLERSLIELSEIPGLNDGHPNQGHGLDEEDLAGVQIGVVEKLRERSIWWIVGTSLIFEALVLMLAGWMFNRRDF
jgi:ABC-type transport system involved in multi-copper enzyme maturation permease subunit